MRNNALVSSLQLTYLMFGADGQLTLKEESEQFYQIQGQLHITERQKCQLLVCQVDLELSGSWKVNQPTTAGQKLQKKKLRGMLVGSRKSVNLVVLLEAPDADEPGGVFLWHLLGLKLVELGLVLGAPAVLLRV